MTEFWIKKDLPSVHRRTCPCSFYTVHKLPTRWNQHQMRPYSIRFVFAFYFDRILNFQNSFRAFRSSQINYPGHNLLTDFKTGLLISVRITPARGPRALMDSEIHSERKLFGAYFIKAIKYNSKLLGRIDAFVELGIHCFWNIFYHLIKYFQNSNAMRIILRITNGLSRRKHDHIWARKSILSIFAMFRAFESKDLTLKNI